MSVMPLIDRINGRATLGPVGAFTPLDIKFIIYYKWYMLCVK
jgi:hypothetical protein